MQRVRMQVGAEFKKRETWMERPLTIAVLDTGIGSHPDLKDSILCFRDFSGGKVSAYDDNGHGTHICGILCGNGQMSGGRLRGMAPGCRLVVGKVLDEKGDGMTETMLAGMEWVLDNRERFQIRVLNISVGISRLRQTQKLRALKQMTQRAWEEGIVVVCAAGNRGPGDGTISSLGDGRKVITVGCHDGAFYRGNPNRCETYSGRGDAASGEKKPDLVAPGTDILSCNAGCKMQYGTIINPYIAKSGTSMATSVVAGAAALLLQKDPLFSNEAVRCKLTYSATDLGEAWNKQGWGMLNVGKILGSY